MKKLFLLIPALILSMIVNATNVTISPETLESDNNIRAALNGTADTILLNAGTYIQVNQIHLKRNVVIKAASSEKPIIRLKYACDFKDGAKVTLEDIIFDGSVSGKNGIYAEDATAGKELRLNNCEFFGFTKAVITTSSTSYTMDSCIVNNCYFRDSKKSSIYFQKSSVENQQTCYGLIVKNSTFANIDVNESAEHYASVIELSTYNNAEAENVKVIVDHCTFYNFLTYNTDHCAIRVRQTTAANCAISNCIFAHPVAQDRRATYLYAGSATNCLTYNLTKDASQQGHTWMTTRTNCLNGNPHFVDSVNAVIPENASYALRNASAARRPDGSVWGDPRWAKNIDVIAVPNILQPLDALCSDKARCTADTAFFAPEDHESEAVDAEYSVEGSQYVKWQISIAKAGKYKFTANTYCKQGHNYRMILLNADETSTINTWQENPDNAGYEWGGQGEDWKFASNVIDMVPGNYVLKMQAKAWGRVMNVVASYEGGAMINVPDTLWPVDALKSEYAFVNEDGELRFTDDSHDGVVREQYGKWKISVAKAGNYKFTVSANSDNAHAYQLILKNSAETSDIASKVQKGSSGSQLKFALDVENLAAGNYVLNIRDTTKYSHGRIHDIAVTYEGGAVVNAPGEILAEEAIIVDNGNVKMFHNANGDLEYGNNGTPSGEYAYWKINATEAGEMVVSFNSPSGGHNFLFELYEGTTLRGSVSEEGTDAIWSHNVTLADHLTIPAAGTYTLRVHNRTKWSTAVLHSVTIEPYVAPAGVTMTDTDEDNSAWVANVGGAAVDVQMNRTILGGMYNTICLPFKLSSTKCKAIFGNDVELYTLGSATLSGDILNLQFNVADDIWNGTPILIKTSSDIVNPLFEGVTIESETADHTNRGIIDFRGTFVQTEFHNGDQVLLLLANDMLAYPQQDRTLKGFRAYFQVNAGSTNNAPIRGARIVTPHNQPTDIDLIGAENQTLKTIENGQLIIIRDGKKYNVMGSKIQ